MPKAIARAAVVLVLLTAAPAVTALASHVPPERRIVPGKSLGPVELGMTREAAVAAMQSAGIAGAPVLRDLGEATVVAFELDPARFPRGQDRSPQSLTLHFVRGVDRVLSVHVDARGRPGMESEQGTSGGTSLLNAARIYRPSAIKTELAYGGRLITEFRDVGIGFVSRAGSQTILEVFVFRPDPLAARQQ